MSEHTSAPWRFTTKGWHPGFRVWDANDLRVCHCDNFHHTPEQSEANARLIAAAPDLLEAAKWGRDLLKRLEPGITEENPVYGSLVDAIDKAKGRR
jgi:hypothetical protein